MERPYDYSTIHNKGINRMKTYKMTYAIYWEVEVQAEDEGDAYEIGKEQIPDMSFNSGDWLLAESEVTQ